MLIVVEKKENVENGGAYSSFSVKRSGVYEGRKAQSIEGPNLT